MNTIQKIDTWTHTHHPVWIDFIRVGLGIFLLLKGIFFIQNTDALLGLIKGHNDAFIALGIVHYVAFAHLVGGILIALGLFTRMAILFQIPVLVGAVFFVNISQGVYNSELWQSLLILILLLVFLLFGSGKFSVDHQVHKTEY